LLSHEAHRLRSLAETLPLVWLILCLAEHRSKGSDRDIGFLWHDYGIHDQIASFLPQVKPPRDASLERPSRIDGVPTPEDMPAHCVRMTAKLARV
jgi:hypothetical protein